MWTQEVLEKIEGKTIRSTEPHYVGEHIYEIVISFTDNTSIIIDKEHHPDHPLQAKFR